MLLWPVLARDKNQPIVPGCSELSLCISWGAGMTVWVQEKVSAATHAQES